jgi:hypothetical protein
MSAVRPLTGAPVIQQLLHARLTVGQPDAADELNGEGLKLAAVASEETPGR